MTAPVASNKSTNVGIQSPQGSPESLIFSTGTHLILEDGAKIWVGGSDLTSTAGGVSNAVAGVASGYKVARGVHQQAAASDTVATGLTTVVAVVVSWRDAPTVKQLYCNATIGNQSGVPAAGSVLIRTYKPTAVDNCTPTAATDFTENLSLNWVAVGT